MDLKPLIKEVLEKGYLMSLGTQDEGGVWVADVTYVFDDKFNIYWMSSPEVRHSKAITANPHVAATITVSGLGQDNLGIQCSGVAEKVNQLRLDLIAKYFIKRQKPAPADSDGFLKGRSWYVLRPAFFELIHEKHFGFKKQKLEL